MADLASSGSIEQDANNIVFLYRDEVYNDNSQDKGICEVIIGKQRQGSPGFIGLKYFGEETRFEDLARAWQPSEPKSYKRKGLAADLWSIDVSGAKQTAEELTQYENVAN